MAEVGVPFLSTIDQKVEATHIQDISKGNTPREVPALMDEGASTTVYSSATEANTPTAPSVALISTVPPVTTPPIPIPAVVFTRNNLATMNKHLERNVKQTDLLAQQLEPYVAKSVAAALAPVHEAIQSPPQQVRKRVRHDIDKTDEEGAAEKAHKRERKEMKKAP
ncbi:hypothetical protein HAX54_008321 [Datura stramonium]|uniref:Uncharacterized protein n=1 Tax=Datura stramonium TaxID=4076 RepID=A0ABS8WXP1_DATST|nr:hypothetical protein [Datura stramonium]